MDGNRFTSISKAHSDEEIGDFWDKHDFTDFDTDASDIDLEMACAVPIEADLLGAIEQQAMRKGVSVEVLVNLWLQQKLLEQLASNQQV
jgi:hypothetical protein